MRLMRWNSVRVRLILWNVAVLALVLGLCGLTLCYRVQAEMMASVDRDLAHMSQGAFHGPHGPRFRPGSFPFRLGPFGRDDHHGPFDWGPAMGSEGRRPMGPPMEVRGVPGFRFPSPGGPPPPGPASTTAPRESAAEARVRWLTGRPHFLRPDGKPLIPSSGETAYDPDSVAPAAAGERRYSTVEIDGQPVRVLSLPIMTWEGRVGGVLQSAYPLIDVQRFTDGQLRTLGTLIPLALLVVAIGGVFLTDRVLRPVRHITQAAAEIGAADLSRRLEVTGQDEFAELATTFNGMIARLDEAFGRLGNAYQRLESAYKEQQRFTADASHELRTPLTRIKGSVSLALSEQREASSYRKTLQVVDAAADVMNRLIQDLLLLARADAAQLRLEIHPLSVAALLEDVVADVPEGKGCPITIRLPGEPVNVLGDSTALARLLLNLIENARRHTPCDGLVTLSAERASGEVVLCVEDTGEGIPPEHLPYVCDRFYRVDTARARAVGGGGTGLGLAICRSIAQAHGGTLSIESAPGRGTAVRVTLPSAGESSPEARESDIVSARK